MLVCFMLLLLSVGHCHPVNCVVIGSFDAFIMQKLIPPPTFIPLAKDTQFALVPTLNWVYCVNVRKNYLKANKCMLVHSQRADNGLSAQQSSESINLHIVIGLKPVSRLIGCFSLGALWQLSSFLLRMGMPLLYPGRSKQWKYKENFFVVVVDRLQVTIQSRGSRTASKVKSLGSKTDWNASINAVLYVFFIFT